VGACHFGAAVHQPGMPRVRRGSRNTTRQRCMRWRKTLLAQPLPESPKHRYVRVRASRSRREAGQAELEGLPHDMWAGEKRSFMQRAPTLLGTESLHFVGIKTGPICSGFISLDSCPGPAESVKNRGSENVWSWLSLALSLDHVATDPQPVP
jgi:hypothetical protein